MCLGAADGRGSDLVPDIAGSLVVGRGPAFSTLQAAAFSDAQAHKCRFFLQGNIMAELGDPGGLVWGGAGLPPLQRFLNMQRYIFF